MITKQLFYDTVKNILSWKEIDEQTGEVSQGRFINKVGSKMKPIMKYSKETKRLHKIGEYDIDKQIESFRNGSDVKTLIKKLREKGLPIEAYMQERAGFYGDVSNAPKDLVEAIDMVNEKFDLFHNLPQLTPVVEPVVETLPVMEEPK